MMFGNKIEVWIRDLTVANSSADVSSDMRLELPDENLEDKIPLTHEYIIIDSELNFGEFDSLYSINNWLLEQDVNADELRILCKTFLWNEVMEKVEKGDYQILDFDLETADYNGGNGVLYDEWWIGYVLHENGMMFEWEKELFDKFGHEAAKEMIGLMEDDLRYENLYTTALCGGLREVNIDNTHYLIW